jgi:hypothetical protein
MSDAHTRREAKAASDMEWMEAILRGPLGNSAIFEEWCAQAQAIRGWSRPTFKRRLKEFKARHPELEGGGWRGDPYSLPTEATGAMAMVERMGLAFQRRISKAKLGVEPGRSASLRFRDSGSQRSKDLTEQALRHLKE